jgi:hypothetical protein
MESIEDIIVRILAQVDQQNKRGQTSPPPLHVGDGEIVPISYAREAARQVFAEALHRLVPVSSTELLTSEMLATMRIALLAKSSQEERNEALDTVKWHARRWEQKYHLDGVENPWVRMRAIQTLVMATIYHAYGFPYTGPIALANAKVTLYHNPNDNAYPMLRRLGLVPSTQIVQQPHRPVSLNHLWRRGIDRGNGNDIDDGVIGIFDSRSETVEDAVKRLMPDVESRLQHALDTIAADDRRRYSGIESVRRESNTAFDWLVRFQVLGQSRRAIAIAEGLDRSHVGREVNKTTDLVGLRLRDPPVGRPRKPRSNTKRIR